MNWKNNLQKLVEKEKWDEAIAFMNEVMKDCSNDSEPYIFMIYFMLNLILEEYYDKNKQNAYFALAEEVFQSSFAKFQDNPEYLYFVGRFVDKANWLFGADREIGEAMMAKARELEPENLIYQEPYFWGIHESHRYHPEVLEYAKKVLSNLDGIAAQLEDKGAAGQYILSVLRHWCTCVLTRDQFPVE